jgi:DnaJ-class molecular chaperone
LYALLGVAPHCTQSEIAKAYRILALQLHPDKQYDAVDPEKTARFVKVAAAYELLSDTDARRRYDHGRMVRSMPAKRQRR